MAGIFPASAAALSVNWNPTGSYTFDFEYSGSHYAHDATISNLSGGNYNISGGYPVGGPYADAWGGTGTISGSTVVNSVNYTVGAPGTHMDMTGTIASDGTMSGTWSDNYGGNRTGTWTTTKGAAIASSIKDFNLDKSLNKSQCSVTKKSTEVVDVSYKLINDYDSAVHNNNWANDTIYRQLNIWRNSDNTFCAIVSDNGQIVTLDGDSPNGSGHISAGVKGTIDGGYTTGQYTSTLLSNPSYSKHGYLGTFDLQCNTDASCPGAHPSITNYTPGWTQSQPWWGWAYTTCQNGNWVNSIDGNFGDITDNTLPQGRNKCDQDKNHHNGDRNHHGDFDRDDRNKHSGPRD